jgi:hypothetical protein
MERLRYFIRRLVVVSAATCWVFVVAQQALASTLMVANPTLTPNPTSAYPGDQITIHGTDFGQCWNRVSVAANVMLSWDGSELTSAAGDSHGEFNVDVAVPSDASAGSHQVTAACYDPQTGTVTSDTLASTEVQVLQPDLQLSSSEAAAGGGVTVTGAGFGQCAGEGLGDSVQLLWDTSPLGSPVGLDGNGAFNVDVTVPAAATAGSGHTVAAECYDQATGSATSDVLASKPFTVIPPTSPTTSPASSPPPDSASPTPTNAPTVTTPSPTPIPGRPSAPSGGQWLPVALTAGLGGSLMAVVLLASVAAIRTRTRLNSSWVHKHLRAVAQPLGAASANARVHSRPGSAPLSIGLEPHPDRLGNQQVKEVTP